MQPFDMAAILATSFDDLGIRYMIGGSVASTYYGEPRTTLDLDIAMEADVTQVRMLAARISRDFYVDAEDAVDAVRNAGSFNLIHYETSTKIDIFVAERRPEVREQMDRRRPIEFEGTKLWICTAEDIVVQKLRWYRLGNEVSERQWRDVVSVLRMKRGDLDHRYMDRIADAFDVRDLLEYARQDAEN
ncbi:MAG TPA: hypothetical protein VND45_02555 [Thermoanaerobaculia bacterium]|jgi:hypothetical protein|nr:hypothetical protein [Thermoanaerobaculia bacterium]